MELELQPLNLPSDNERPFVIAGPCSAETEEQVMNTARQLAMKGCHNFRAGVWKPRTKPGGFEGNGEKALPWMKQVKDENGQPYFDNRVSVTIKRQDGSVFFKKVFTKASFSSYIDDTFRNNGILAGIQYDEIGDRGLEFSVVVGMPDALDDVFVPLELVIDRQGAISISRDDDMDMLDYDDREGDFDEEGV